MTHRIHNNLLCLLVLIMPLTACAQQHAPSTSAASPPAAQTAPAPQLVAGLPDFTRLVEQAGPAVVNVESTISRRAAAARSNGGMPDDDQIPEFFRRFFGPDGMPGMPAQPRGRAPDDDDGAPAGRSMGSGFIISSDGYVLTNHHVIDGASEVKVKLTDRREFTAKVVGSDQQYDVALLKIDGKNLPTARIGDSNLLKSGQWVVAIGSPFGLDHSVTAGIVSATGRSNPYADQRYVPFIQTDVAINQGNSGGPLLNTRGEVVGINSQIFSASGGYMGISLAIPIDLAMSAVEQIKKTGKVTRAQLGVMVGPIDALKAQGLGLPDTRGALVNQLVEGGPAARAGLEVGDVIRAVNGTEIGAFSDLPPMIGVMQPGTKVRLSILRDGKPRDISVQLTALADDRTAGARSAGADNTAPAHGANALLGIEVADLDAASRQQLGLEPGKGVRIAAVTGRSARDAQLVPGMVILQVGRVPVGSVAALNQQLSGYKKGDVVMLLISYRNTTSFVAVRAGG
ncbi:DegQ family serine endoprotease [Xanthomonas albilineans]|uniref:DegQ family serine endoprotease n=1 Tax=Xanthomonas albilineans TaxID=29447 RepID=UPI0005F32E95|nr:DegQ family serine endoprotease [Xanthomonas albilineans]PPU93521.1 peptidase S1 [Xanthomonas albilineans]